MAENTNSNSTETAETDSAPEEQQNQIADMLDLGPVTEGDETPSKDESFEDPLTSEKGAKDEPPVFDDDNEEDESDPVTEDDESDDADDASDDETPDETPDDEAANLRATVARLTEALNKSTSTGVIPTGEGKLEGSAKREEVAVEKPIASPPAEPISFVTKEDYRKALTSPEGFNEVLNKVVAATEERVLRGLPSLVDGSVARTTYLNNAVADFYAQNQDLVDHKGYVGFKFKEMQKAEPTLDPVALLVKTAEAVRKDLGLKATAKAVENARRSTGGSPAPTARKKAPHAGRQRGASSGGQNGEPITGQQKQILDLL